MGFHARKLCSLKTIEQIEQNHSRQLYHQILKKKIPTTHVVCEVDQAIVSKEKKQKVCATYSPHGRFPY